MFGRQRILQGFTRISRLCKEIYKDLQGFLAWVKDLKCSFDNQIGYDLGFFWIFLISLNNLLRIKNWKRRTFDRDERNTNKNISTRRCPVNPGALKYNKIAYWRPGLSSPYTVNHISVGRWPWKESYLKSKKIQKFITKSKKSAPLNFWILLDRF